MERVSSQFTLRISKQILTKCQPEYHTNVMEHLKLFVIHSMAKLLLLDLELVVLPPLELSVEILTKRLSPASTPGSH